MISQRIRPLWVAAAATLGATPACTRPSPQTQPPPREAAPDATSTEPLLTRVRQITFAGRRAGEAYFSADDQSLVFQSEREPGNPFYQIYVMDLATGATTRITPGHGKATCAWIHPDGTKVLFASTHEDPEARADQRRELEDRASGKQRRYSWDFDEDYEIYEVGRAGGEPNNLTRARGYDAEGSWSPDGSRIVFASNRAAHDPAAPLDEETRRRVEQDPSYAMDLYIMDADGSNVRRLTDSPGYDGGPFFSPDGQRITWRRFTLDGKTAEVWTMRVDGTDARQITRLGAMSWAPFYHPSGEYLVFTTNLHGYGNFELYIVDAEGARDPVRVTYTEGFDGLPVFSHDGRTLAWSSSRTPDGSAQVFLADWDDAQARRLLGLRSTGAPPKALPERSDRIAPDRIAGHVRALADPALGGRLAGSPGEQKATEYVAARLAEAGIAPGAPDGTFFESFPFVAGVALAPGNELVVHRTSGGAAPTAAGTGAPASPAGPERPTVDEAWRPLGFSATGEGARAPVVFAGYGIVAPAQDGQPAYDSYGALEVRDRWVVVLRTMPEDITPERRQHLSRFAPLRHKAMIARERGARGLVVVSGPRAHTKEQLVPLGSDAAQADSGILAISVTDAVVQGWLAAMGKDLEQVQEALDGGEAAPGFAIEGVELEATVALAQEERIGRNVLGRILSGSDAPALVIGAHVDALGHGDAGGSLARADEKGQVHPGADDNASGVAALIEIGRTLAEDVRAGRLTLARDVILAAWSGEELGLLGSKHFVETRLPKGRGATLASVVAANLNLDMVGRLREALVLQGTGSSDGWGALLERHVMRAGLPVRAQTDSYLPTDATSFYLRGVPVLNGFTGAHAEYHAPRDVPALLNYDGAARIAELFASMARELAAAPEAPGWVELPEPDRRGRAGLRAYLGTIPDYAQGDAGGVLLSGVQKGSPAQAAGLREGDRIVELAGRAITNVYDYSYALQALKIGEPVEVVVKRGGERVRLRVTPASKE